MIAPQTPRTRTVATGESPCPGIRSRTRFAPRGKQAISTPTTAMTRHPMSAGVRLVEALAMTGITSAQWPRPAESEARSSKNPGYEMATDSAPSIWAEPAPAASEAATAKAMARR